MKTQHSYLTITQNLTNDTPSQYGNGAARRLEMQGARVYIKVVHTTQY